VGGAAGRGGRRWRGAADLVINYPSWGEEQRQKGQGSGEAERITMQTLRGSLRFLPFVEIASYILQLITVVSPRQEREVILISTSTPSFSLVTASEKKQLGLALPHQQPSAGGQRVAWGRLRCLTGSRAPRPTRRPLRPLGRDSFLRAGPGGGLRLGPMPLLPYPVFEQW